MLVKLENINEKSFQNYTFSEDMKLCNIFFGTNGSGKTSLSSWLYKQSQDVRKFDTDYVVDNISMVDSLSGVKLTVGSDRIIMEEAIANIEDSNNNISQLNSQIGYDEEKYRERVFDFMEQKLKEARGQFNLSKKINQKRNAKTNTMEALYAWSSDIIDTSHNEDVSSSAEIELMLTKLRAEKNAITFQFERKFDFIEELVQLLNKKIVKLDFEMTTELSEWLRVGLKIHSEHTGKRAVCEFCKNDFDFDKIKNEVNTKLDSDYAIAIERLTKIRSTIEIIHRDFESQPDEVKQSNVKKVIGILESIMEIIDRKMSNLSLEITEIPSVVPEYIIAINDIKKKTYEIQKSIEEKEELLSRIENVAKNWIAREILQVYPIEDVKNRLKEFKAARERNTDFINENNKWIEQNKPTGELQPFADLVNHEFKVIGLNIEMKVSNDSYLLKHRENQEVIIKIKDLSEGERRLLGFLHFYYDLYLEPNKSLKPNLEMILIDDPITSLDSDNRYYLTELVNEAIRNLIGFNKQVFIFTHSSIDFHNFGYNTNQKSVLKCIISKDTSGNSQIKKIESQESKNYSDYYRVNLKSLFEFAIISNSKIGNFPNCIQFGNKGRLVLESHARSNYCLENATAASLKQLVKLYNIPESKIEIFRRMLDVINSLSHGLSFYDKDVNTISPREVRDNIRKLIGILYLNDRNHIIAMLGLNSDSRELARIEKWF